MNTLVEFIGQDHVIIEYDESSEVFAVTLNNETCWCKTRTELKELLGDKVPWGILLEVLPRD